jgi:hypothetical protein
MPETLQYMYRKYEFHQNHVMFVMCDNNPAAFTENKT